VLEVTRVAIDEVTAVFRQREQTTEHACEHGSIACERGYGGRKRLTADIKLHAVVVIDEDVDGVVEIRLRYDSHVFFDQTHIPAKEPPAKIKNNLIRVGIDEYFFGERHGSPNTQDGTVSYCGSKNPNITARKAGKKNTQLNTKIRVRTWVNRRLNESSFTVTLKPFKDLDASIVNMPPAINKTNAGIFTKPKDEHIPVSSCCFTAPQSKAAIGGARGRTHAITWNKPDFFSNASDDHCFAVLKYQQNENINHHVAALNVK